MESSSEEISLRDVYLVLKRNLVLILGFSLGLGALVLLLSFVLPANFSSQVVINLAVDNGRSEFKAAPNVLGLSQGFIQLVNNESLAEKLGEERLGNHYKAKFDEKKSLLTLSSQGSTAQQAFERAKRFEQAAIEYFNAQLSAIVKTNIGATLVQTKLDIANTKDNLKRLEPLLQNSQFVLNNSENAAALESRGVNPQLARASNPALVNLALQISQLRVALAAQQARQISLENLLNDPTSFAALLSQGFQVQVLSKPTPALEPEFPKPGLMTALALVAGLLLGVVGAFVYEALRDPQEDSKRVVTGQRLPQVISD